MKIKVVKNSEKGKEVTIKAKDLDRVYFKLNGFNVCVMADGDKLGLIIDICDKDFELLESYIVAKDDYDSMR